MKRTLLVIAMILGISGVASAASPYRYQSKSVIKTAAKLEKAARNLYRSAEYSGGYRGGASGKALHALGVFGKSARNFRQGLGRYYIRPANTAYEFRKLTFAYQRAAQAIRYLPRSGRFYRNLRNIKRLMSQLSVYYGNGSGYGHGNGYRYSDNGIGPIKGRRGFGLNNGLAGPPF